VPPHGQPCHPLYSPGDSLFGSGGMPEHPPHFALQICVAGGGTFDETLAIVITQNKSGVEHRFQPAPAFFGQVQA
jgi:hypothetical protein